MLDSLRLWLLWQLSLTAFLVAVMVILKMYASTAFYSFWTKAWCFFGMSLACSWLALDRDLAGGSAKWVLLCMSLLLTSLQVSCLFLGTIALRRRATPGPDLRQVFMVGGMVLGLLVFLFTFLFKDYPQWSFAVRAIARSSALAAAYLYAALAVRRYMHYSTSRGARLVTWSCIAYAGVEALEAWNAVLVGALQRFSVLRQNLFLLDGACEAFLTVSMLLLWWSAAGASTIVWSSTNRFFPRVRSAEPSATTP